jgi:hypothetical protein
MALVAFSTVVVMISLSRTQWMQFQSVAKSSFASQQNVRRSHSEFP